MSKIKTFSELAAQLKGLELGDLTRFEYDYARGCFMKSYEVEIRRAAEASWEVSVIVNERYGAVVRIEADQVVLVKVAKGERQPDSAVAFELEGAELVRLREVTTDTVIIEILEELEKYRHQ